MFQNGVLKRIFGSKSEERTGEWRRLRNAELNGVYSQSIMQVIKSKRMRWAGHVACMGVEERCIQGFVGET